MKTRKVSALLLAFVMLAVFIAACTDGAAPGDTAPPAADDTPVADGNDTPAADDQPDTDEPPADDDIITLVIAFPGAASEAEAAVMEAVNAQLISDGYNFNVEILYFDDFFTQLPLTIAGGEVIDLAWSHFNHLGNMVRMNVLQPIDDALASHGPVLLAHTPEFLMMGGSIGGVQYAMPRVVPMSYHRNVLNIRGDIRESHGIPPITTLDHLEAFLQAVTEYEDDMYGIIGWLPDVFSPVYLNAHMLIEWIVYATPDDPTVHSLWHSDEMSAMMERIWRWSQNGWIPPQEVIDRLDGGDAGFDHGFVAAVTANAMRASERIDFFTHNVPEGTVETVLLLPDRSWNFFAGDNALAVPTTSNNVNEAVAFVNWLKSTQENFDLFSFGIEGVNYTLVDGGVDTSIGTGENNFSMHSWMWDDLRLNRFSANFSQADIDQLMVWDDAAEISPYLGFVFDQDPVSTQMGMLSSVVWGNMGQWNNGQFEFAPDRDRFLGELEAAGLQDVLDEAQRQLDAFMAGR